MIEGLARELPRSCRSTAYPAHRRRSPRGMVNAFAQVSLIGLEIAAPVLVALVLADVGVRRSSRAPCRR